MIKRNRYKLLIEPHSQQVWRLVERQCTYEGFKPGVPDALEIYPDYESARRIFNNRKTKEPHNDA